VARPGRKFQQRSDTGKLAYAGAGGTPPMGVLKSWDE